VDTLLLSGPDEAFGFGVIMNLELEEPWQDVHCFRFPKKRIMHPVYQMPNSQPIVVSA